MDLLGPCRRAARRVDQGPVPPDLPAYRIAGEIRLLAHEVDAFHEKFPNPGELL
jgi:hypothetical protein